MMQLQPPSGNTYWLKIGMTAVALATLLAVLLIAGKTPLLSSLLPDENSFQRALVLHVDLNMTLWVGAIACFLWGTHLASWVNRVGAVLVGTGFVLWLYAYASPALPILNNYMPVFDTASYFVGLALIMAGFCWMALQWLIHYTSAYAGPATSDLLDFSKSLMAILLLAAVLNAMTALVLLEMRLHDASYFEQLFWGFGHVWQLLALQIMVTAWLTLMPFAEPPTKLEKLLWKLPIVAAMTGFLAPILIHPDTPLYRTFFTHYMAYSSLWVIPLVWRLFDRDDLAWTSPHKLSAGLFLLGLILGTLIRKDNLMVPAHYHAMTGAINLSMMALVMQQLIPKAGTLSIFKTQRILYTTGVFFLAGGLAWSGLLGGMRKLTLAAQLVDDWQHLAVLSLMGLGGLMAIGGIFLFLGISLPYMRRRSRSSSHRVMEPHHVEAK